jgi:hypothetical protein
MVSLAFASGIPKHAKNKLIVLPEKKYSDDK